MPSKIGGFNNSIPIDLKEWQWLGDVLRAVVKEGDGDERILPHGEQQYYRSFAGAVEELSLQGLEEVVPYQLRHSGPSSDIAAKRRTLAEVKERGDWCTDSSLKRYQKGGRLGDQANRLTKQQQDHGRECAAKLEDVLCQRLPPVPRPNWR